jgi:hypothetical protein
MSGEWLKDWKKVAVAAGALAAGGAVVYYLLKEDQHPLVPVEKDASNLPKTPTVEEFKKEDVQQILEQIIKSQEQMKVHMKALTKELLAKQMNFQQTYQRVLEVQPKDPLEEYGLSMLQFDQVLDKFQSDPGVREAIAKIMGAPDPSNATSEKVQSITVKKIIEVHTFMQEELSKLVDHVQSMPGRDSLDMKTVTIAAQAIVGSKMEQKFSITSEDIESAVLLYHTMLATDQTFAQLNMQIQTTMSKLMGSPLAPGGM